MTEEVTTRLWFLSHFAHSMLDSNISNNVLQEPFDTNCCKTYSKLETVSENYLKHVIFPGSDTGYIDV